MGKSVKCPVGWIAGVGLALMFGACGDDAAVGGTGQVGTGACGVAGVACVCPDGRASTLACIDGGTSYACQCGPGGGAGGLPLIGGGGQTALGDDTPVVGDSDWCQTLGVLRTSCQGCHAAELAFGAPMPLVTYADTQALSTFDGATPIFQRISARIHSDSMPMPPTSQPQLTADQKATIDAWVAAGAPPGEDPECTGANVPDAPVETSDEWVWPDDCEEFYEFRAGEGDSAHVVGAGAETHPQFYFDVPWTGEVQALGIRPITDNKRILHHWILYQGDNFLTGWAPGSKGDRPPDGVGTYMPSSGQLRLDVHYFNVGNPEPEEDRSGVEICITRTLRPNTATTFPFTGPAYAPAGQRYESSNTCTVNAPNGPVTLIGSSPHMHQLGVHAKLEVLRQGGGVEVVHDLPFSFEDQYAVSLDPGVQLFDGDQVRVTCVYENTTSNLVLFGDGSNDEMCFNFAKYYPMCGFSCRGGETTSQLISDSQGGGCPTQ